MVIKFCLNVLPAFPLHFQRSATYFHPFDLPKWRSSRRRAPRHGCVITHLSSTQFSSFWFPPPRTLPCAHFVVVLKSQRWSSAGADSINPDNWKDFTPRIDYNEASCNLVSLAQRVDFMLAWARTGLLPVCSGGYEDTWVDYYLRPI